MFPDQCKGPVLQAQRGAFFDSYFGPLAVAAEGGENGDIEVDAQRIIPPMPGRDHPPVKIEDALQLGPVERGNLAPVPVAWEWRNYAQALFALG